MKSIYLPKGWKGVVNNETQHLMIDACKFASFRLAEIESRAGFQQKIHYEGVSREPQNAVLVTKAGIGLV